MTRDEALARADLAEFLERVGESRGLRVVRGKYPCPDLAHTQSGDTPPVAIREQSGVDVWYCHACEKGGSIVDAMVASGRAADPGDALEQLGVEKPSREQRKVADRPGEVVAQYIYADERGTPRMRVLRYEPKDFRQQRWEDGRWAWGAPDEPVLYRLPDVLAALARNEVVFIVEGEKDADALRAAGKTATTMPGGAGKWRDEYTASLAGAKHRVVVVADDDDPGHRHAADVWRRLQGKVGQVVARLPAEGFRDVSAQLDAGVPFSSSSLRRLPSLDAAPPTNGAPAGPLMLTARAMAARPSPTAALRVVGPLFQRGMRTTIGAGTGEGKTTLALQAIRSLVEREPFLDEAWRPARPGRALIVDLEQGEETVKTRLREAGLADCDAVDVLWEPAGLALDNDPTHQALIRDTVKAGRYDLVLLDPLYQMHRGNANDERTAADLMRLVDAWAREFDFSLVIPMHARKPHPEAKSQFTIHDIAGSTSWNRNAEFVLGIQLMSAGTSRMWFFKDRIGHGPEIRSHWWLRYDRADGFSRTYQENRDAVRSAFKHLLSRVEGATAADLAAVPGAIADTSDIGPTSVDAYLRKHGEPVGEGRFRYVARRREVAVPEVIPGQTQMLAADEVT